MSFERNRLQVRGSQENRQCLQQQTVVRRHPREVLIVRAEGWLESEHRSNFATCSRARYRGFDHSRGGSGGLLSGLGNGRLAMPPSSVRTCLPPPRIAALVHCVGVDSLQMPRSTCEDFSPPLAEAISSKTTSRTPSSGRSKDRLPVGVVPDELDSAAPVPPQLAEVPARIGLAARPPDVDEHLAGRSRTRMSTQRSLWPGSLCHSPSSCGAETPCAEHGTAKPVKTRSCRRRTETDRRDVLMATSTRSKRGAPGFERLSEERVRSGAKPQSRPKYKAFRRFSSDCSRTQRR